MKRLLSIFLTAVMILATFATAIMDVAAATDTGSNGSAEGIYLSVFSEGIGTVPSVSHNVGLNRSELVVTLLDTENVCL